MDTALLLYGVGLVLILIAIYYFFASFIYGAGYQPTPRTVGRRMMDMAQVGPDDHVIDLGAGTGSLLFMAAEDRGAEVLGIEAEPIRFLYLRLRRAMSPAKSRISLRRENLFQTNLRNATVVLMFLWPPAMARLKTKLDEELVPGARVVSYYHPIPGRMPDGEDRKLKIYSYVQKERAQN